MLIKKTKLFAAALLTLLICSPSVAYAHNSYITFTPTQAAYNTLTRFTITTTQQTEGSLQTVRVALPDGATNTSGLVNSGWETTVTDDYVQWQGLLQKGQTVDLTFATVTPKNGSDITFQVFRTFSDGMTDEHTFVTQLSTQSPADGKANSDTISKIALIAGLAGLVVGTAALVVSSRTHKPKSHTSRK